MLLGGPDRLVLFTGFLVDSKLKSTMVRSYISAIRCVFADLGEKLEENMFLMKSLTRACRVKNDHIVRRLPISTAVLKLLLDGLTKMFGSQPYLEKLYSALFSSAFYGLLQIGEVAQSPHVILVKNVHVGQNKDKILFILESSKTHTKGDKPQLVKITKSTTAASQSTKCSTYCPFELIRNFIKVRQLSEKDNEQFFIFADRSPVIQSNVRKVHCSSESSPSKYTCLHIPLFKVGQSFKFTKARLLSGNH